jgi:hypothetical protein
MLETDADRQSYMEAFGVPVTWASGTFTAIFDDAFVGANPGDAFVESSSPRILCRTSDVEGILSRTAIEVATIPFRVLSNQPDGTGLTVLVLERQT